MEPKAAFFEAERFAIALHQYYAPMIKTSDEICMRWLCLDLALSESVLCKVDGVYEKKKSKVTRSSDLRPELLPVPMRDLPVSIMQRTKVAEEPISERKSRKNAGNSKRDACKASDPIIKPRKYADKTRMLPIGPNASLEKVHPMSRKIITLQYGLYSSVLSAVYARNSSNNGNAIEEAGRIYQVIR